MSEQKKSTVCGIVPVLRAPVLLYSLYRRTKCPFLHCGNSTINIDFFQPYFYTIFLIQSKTFFIFSFIQSFFLKGNYSEPTSTKKDLIIQKSCVPFHSQNSFETFIETSLFHK